MSTGLTGEMIAYYEADMYEAKMEAVVKTPPKHPDLFNMITIPRELGSKEAQMPTAGELKQHQIENESIDFKVPVQGWTSYTEFQLFSDGLKFSKQAVERSVPEKVQDVLKKLAKSWGFSEHVERETYAATVFNEGGTLAGNDVFNGSFGNEVDPSGDLPYDSVPLFALTGNNHVTKAGGTGYFNSVAGLTLTAANFQTIHTRHTSVNNRDEFYDRIVENPADTLLTETGDDAIKAMEILKSDLKPDGALNNINAYSRLGLTHIAWDYLDDSAFFIMRRQDEAINFVNAQPAEVRFFRDETNLAYCASINAMWSIWIKAGAYKAITRGGGSST